MHIWNRKFRSYRNFRAQLSASPAAKWVRNEKWINAKNHIGKVCLYHRSPKRDINLHHLMIFCEMSCLVLVCFFAGSLRIFFRKKSNHDIYNNLNYGFYNTSAGQTKLFQVQNATKFAIFDEFENFTIKKNFVIQKIESNLHVCATTSCKRPFFGPSFNFSEDC